MSKFNKSYRIRTEVGKDTQLFVNLDQDYEVLEIMSLKINQKNAYRLHTSNYGVIAGRVLANDAVGIPNAKISVFININNNDSEDVIKSVLYPYNTTNTQDKNGVRYNLLPDEQVNNCHTIIGTFPEKQYLLDNGDLLEIFEEYYKYTTRTNESGDYMIFGVPTGSQTVHVDIDLSDIGILSQRPRDMVYKGYNIEQFENPNKFKYETNLENLTQVFSQNVVTDVIPFWGDEEEGSIGISRCDIKIQYKFEPTCIFIGSVVSDTASNGISKKCIPSPLMGAMDELTTGSGTIEMIRKTPLGDVEEFQIKGTQLIDGDGIWCYQIPMNLDYVMTDEYGNMVPTNDPQKGIPTRTKVRFRISMQDFDNDSTNMAHVKVLVPHNPNIYSDQCEEELDYQFGTNTKDSSYKDLFWNGVYSVKSFIPRIQKGKNWKHEKFTGFKRVNYYGDKNPIPYNNIRIKIPFMFTILCALIKCFIGIVKFLNKCFNFIGASLVQQEDDDGNKLSGSFISLSGELCNDNLDYLCIIPGVNIQKIADRNRTRKTTLLGMAIVAHYEDMGGDLKQGQYTEYIDKSNDSQSIDNKNKVENTPSDYTIVETGSGGKGKENSWQKIGLPDIIVTNSTNYLLQCIEMNLAQEYRIIQFDFYNDWINGLIYIPRWMRSAKKNGKVKACNENFKSGRNIVQQCGLSYDTKFNVTNEIGCKSRTLVCHKSNKVRKSFRILKSSGIVKTFKNSKNALIYYLKPYEISDSKNVRLFATDIILLGSLNDCDKWGIPNNLKELSSSSYQMPPNLALTDSEIDGNEYEAKAGSDRIYLKYWANGKCTDINLNGRYTSIGPMPETGNYTEIAGVNWNYNGPLQMDNTKGGSDLFNPGGHFLGLSCRNSSTTIKTCVNLSRICEYGVWMSQRHDLSIPDENKDIYIDDYATIPSGFISKDELSGTNYRRMFATMNHNGLKTVLNEETGYLKYDFTYLNPTNFGGELTDKISYEENYNRFITSTVTENEWENEDDDDDYHKLKEVGKTEIKETQIMRTGEYHDSEYLNFRFGEFNDKKDKRFLIKEYNGNYSFPMYNNSYYFYFGLHDGRTALDEFKKQFYSVCEKSNDLIQIDDYVSIYDINIKEYAGINTNTGKASFKVKARDLYFENEGKLYIYIDNIEKGIITKDNKDSEIIIEGLSKGNHNIQIIQKVDNVEEELDYANVEIKEVSVKGKLIFVDFNQDVTKLELNDINVSYGGYFNFEDNKISYEDENGITDYEITKFNHIIVDYTYTNTGGTLTSGTTVITETNTTIDSETIKYQIIPTALSVIKNCEIEYNVYLKTNINNGKLELNSGTMSLSNSTHTWYIGSGKIHNGIDLTLRIGKVSSDRIMKYDGIDTSYSNSSGATDGWWNEVFSDNEEGELLKWSLKDVLFFNDITSTYTHSITTNIGGGKSPYTTKLCGEDNEGNSFNSENDLTNLSNITKPTINYYYNKKINNVDIWSKRPNFGINVTDKVNKSIPSSGNVITLPLIFKPFFTEMCVLYFDETKDYYLYGNIYNGKTWTIDEGFNNIKLNGVKINNFCNIENGNYDHIMKLNETLPWDNEKLQDINNPTSAFTLFKEHNFTDDNFTGLTKDVPYFQYNGRKVNGSSKLDGATFGLNTSRVMSNFVLSIGSEHMEDGVTYKDSTDLSMQDSRLFTFKTSSTNANSNYKVKLEPSTDIGNNYEIILIDNEKLPYPTIKDGNIDTFSDELFRYLMCDYKDISGYTTTDSNINVSDYIDISDSKLSGKKFYYIIIPNLNKDELLKTTSNSFNRIKPISISSLINIDDMGKFYPFDEFSTGSTIVVNAENKEVSITIVKGDRTDDNKFKNKTLKIKLQENGEEFYDFEMKTRNNTSITQTFNDDFDSFPKFDNTTEVTNTLIDYTCDWYDGDKKSPTSITGKIAYTYIPKQNVDGNV